MAIKVKDSWIQEHTRRDGRTFYTVHIKVKFLFFFSRREDLNKIYSVFFFLPSDNLFSNAYPFPDEKMAREQLNIKLKLIEEENQMQEDKIVVGSRRI
jgi:hypothetical protein